MKKRYAMYDSFVCTLIIKILFAADICWVKGTVTILEVTEVFKFCN